MSRPLRIEYEGAYYHVMNRGLDRRNIFNKKGEYHLFLNLLSDIHDRFGVEVHAYCLMPNHYHLYIRTPASNLSRAMRHLNGVYTQQYNRRAKRDGPLFRGRYKAILVEGELYSQVLQRYIHLNPVKAGIVKKPEDFLWSSYGVYLNQRPCPKWVYRTEVMNHWGGISDIEAYKEYTESGIGQTDELTTILNKKYLPSILGTTAFIERINVMLKRSVNKEVPKKMTVQRQYYQPSLTLLTRLVTEYYNVKKESLLVARVGGKENTPRSVFIYLAVECYGYRLQEVGDELGGISYKRTSAIKETVKRKKQDDALLLQDINSVQKILRGLESK